MGEVAGAGLLAHVPTIMLPYEQRLELNEGKEISLVTGLQRLRAEIFEALDYDTVVVLDSHWHTTVEFVVAAQQMRAGRFTSDELPRGMCQIPYEWRGDPGLARAVAGQAGPGHLTHAPLLCLPRGASCRVSTATPATSASLIAIRARTHPVPTAAARPGSARAVARQARPPGRLAPNFMNCASGGQARCASTLPPSQVTPTCR